MRSSTILALIGATIAVASPVNHHQAMHKKALVYDEVIDIVTITVTAGVPLPTTSSSTSTSAPAVHRKPKTPAAPKPAEPTPALPPPPPPASTPKPVVVAPPPPPAPASEPPAPVSNPVFKAADIPVPASAPVPAPVPAPAPAPVAASPGTAAGPSDYKSTCLLHHSAHRKNNSANALDWDDTLAGYAKTIANKCVFAHDMTQGGGGYGQNLAAYGTTADMSKIDLSTVVADAITNQWYYGEAQNMPFGQNSPAVTNVPEFLHYSQLVWKSSTKVGCYTAMCGAGTIFSYHSLFTVCNYASTGNVLGSFATEVTPPIGLPPITAHIR